MLSVHNPWIRGLWGLATIAAGAIHPFLLIGMLLCGLFIFSSYMESAIIFLIWLMAFGLVERWRLAIVLVGGIVLVYAIEWLKTRLIVY